MSSDPQSEFERIYGMTQKAKEAKPAPVGTPGATQKLPGDSDLLGIRTDSDRFIVSRIPEDLSGASASKEKSSASDAPSKKPETDPTAKSAQEAMTIALNVNVFANIADAKKPGSVVLQENAEFAGRISELVNKNAAAGPHADGPTFVIPRPGGGDTSKEAAPAASSEFTPVLDSKSPPPIPNTEFTRVLHIEESVKVPRPSAKRANDDALGSTIAVTPETNRASRPEPEVVTAPGPSDFTKVVKGSEMRALQEKLAAAAANQAAGRGQQWQAPQAPLPQYVPNTGNSSSLPELSSASQPSKLSQYMPVIIVLNLLVLMAILLIVFFALKK
jgi:hypothetical protein